MNCLLKRMFYCPGNGQELLSALGVTWHATLLMFSGSIKFPVQIVRGVVLGKPAELSIPEKRNIRETPKLLPKVLQLLITPGPTTTPLLFKTSLLLTFRSRKPLEAWHTRVTPNVDNNYCLLPGQYNILFNKHS